MLFVLSAPSGSGKTTIARSILDQFDQLSFSVSATTRTRRPKELDGKDYFFLSREEFDRRITAGGLVEWEEIYGNLYGTLKAEVDRVLEADEHLLFDIDVKGALSVKQIYAEQAVLVFIKPPSLEVLRERLERRGTDSADVIDRRMQRSQWEIEQAEHFDHVVVNDDLSLSIPAVAGLITTYLNHGK